MYIYRPIGHFGRESNRCNMRWTKESRDVATEMLCNGEALTNIVVKTGMSLSSVKSLKYSTVKTHTERVVCEVCKQTMKQITHKHLRSHNMTIGEYAEKYPDAKMITEARKAAYMSYVHPNKGKTYEQIYGAIEADKKRKKISNKQIGRKTPKLAGTGISGTRKDTGLFARSTYEANVDRIFKLEGFKVADEFSELNPRHTLKRENGEIITYQPDRVDLDGLFCKGALLEIKGYMHPDGWEKICLFRKQFPDKKLIVISPDKTYCDISYKELKQKYKDRIYLWEGDDQNYRKNPELYNGDYVETEVSKFLSENYTNGISNSITENHKLMIASKCVNYNAVALGKKVYVNEVNLLKIADRRPNSRVSTGRYNYELWEVLTHCKKRFFVANQSKTTLFYCHQEEDLPHLMEFFENNCKDLPFGPKQEQSFRHIREEVLNSFERRDILMKIEDCFSHKGIQWKVTDIRLINSTKSQKHAVNDYEEWEIIVDNQDVKYILSNFGRSTKEYVLLEILDCSQGNG